LAILPQSTTNVTAIGHDMDISSDMTEERTVI